VRSTKQCRSNSLTTRTSCLRRALPHSLYQSESTLYRDHHRSSRAKRLIGSGALLSHTLKRGILKARTHIGGNSSIHLWGKKFVRSFTHSARHCTTSSSQYWYKIAANGLRWEGSRKIGNCRLVISKTTASGRGLVGLVFSTIVCRPS
jgi:hypothetical protein